MAGAAVMGLRISLCLVLVVAGALGTSAEATDEQIEGTVTLGLPWANCTFNPGCGLFTHSPAVGPVGGCQRNSPLADSVFHNARYVKQWTTTARDATVTFLGSAMPAYPGPHNIVVALRDSLCRQVGNDTGDPAYQFTEAGQSSTFQVPKDTAWVIVLVWNSFAEDVDVRWSVSFG